MSEKLVIASASASASASDSDSAVASDKDGRNERRTQGINKAQTRHTL